MFQPARRSLLVTVEQHVGYVLRGPERCRGGHRARRQHGPYLQWTRKVAAKTIGRWLSPDQHRDYQPWIDNDRRLHELLTRLEALGAAAFEADPSWER